MLKMTLLAVFSTAALSACGQNTSSSTSQDGQESDLAITHYVEEVETPVEVLEALAKQPTPMAPADEDVTTTIVAIEQIINLGKEIWKIVEAGQPVTDVKHDYANALPKGVAGAEDLEGFSDLESKSYRYHGKNPYGMTVYDVTYTLVHQHSGSYQGKGKFLSGVSVIPSKISVMWGYSLDLKTTKVNAVNVGTAEDPVASLTMELKFKVGTVIKKEEVTKIFQFRGDSAEVKESE